MMAAWQQLMQALVSSTCVCLCRTQVNNEAEKISREADEAILISAQVQQELDKALPALQAAEAALNVIEKKDLAELKAYAKPPALVEVTLNAGN